MLAVCFVAPTAWPVLSRDRQIPLLGGAAVQQAILARLFAARGYRVSMICLDFGQPARARVDGVEVHRIFDTRAGIPGLRFVHPRLTSMWRALKAAEADIYYFRTAAMWVGVLAEFCRRTGRRLVYAGASDKDFERDQGGQIPYARDRWLYRHGLKRAHAIVAQNEYQRASCLATYGREAVVIPSCYELPNGKSYHAPGDVVLWVGTLREGKRPGLFLDLAERLPARRFVMIGGPGANRALYEAIAARAARLPNVEFKGFVPLEETERWFDRARVLVNTSAYEGMPNTFLQAWARGVPSVATVDVGSPVHCLATTLDELADNVEAAFRDSSWGERCRDYFQKTHSSAEVARRYEELFGQLVRCLDAATFGEYRLLWLVVGTIMTFATLSMCGTLYYFVPRSEPRKKRLHVHQTMLYLALAGTLCGLAVGPWNPLLPAAIQPLEAYGALVPAFVALWVMSILLDYLPTIDERIRLQGYATLSIALLRALLVGAGAWLTGDLQVVIWLLLAVVLIKFAVLLIYVARQHGLGPPWFEARAFAEQFGHSAPFGVSNALFALRAQTDQWVAASLFALTSFAAFSIAAIVHHVVHVFRHSVMEAFMPTMSRLQAAGDVRGMLELNRRANAMVGTALFPLLAIAFVFAEEILTIVYTASFVEAAPAMRVYIVGMVAMVIEIGSVVLLLKQGPFALRMTAATLAIAVAVSFGGAHLIGLTGAALGSVLAIYLDRAMMLTRVSRLTGVGWARVQNWRALGWALATTMLAAALAWFGVETLVPDHGSFTRLVCGAAILAGAYVAFNWRRLAR